MSVTDKKLNKSVSVRLGVDSLTSNTWLMESTCETSSCKNMVKFSRFKDISSLIKIKFIKGQIEGKLDEVDLDLNGIMIKSMQILLISEENYNLLEVSELYEYLLNC